MCSNRMLKSVIPCFLLVYSLSAEAKRPKWDPAGKYTGYVRISQRGRSAEDRKGGVVDCQWEGKDDKGRRLLYCKLVHARKALWGVNNMWTAFAETSNGLDGNFIQTFRDSQGKTLKTACNTSRPPIYDGTKLDAVQSCSNSDFGLSVTRSPSSKRVPWLKGYCCCKFDPVGMPEYVKYDWQHKSKCTPDYGTYGSCIKKTKQECEKMSKR